MSGNAWYLHRADECTRFAKDAGDPIMRAQYEDEARVWRQIADDVAKNERDRFGSDAT
jgi:hypothetical protein